MPEPPADYTAALATQLRKRHPDLLAAENELQRLRRLVADVVDVINDPRFDYDTRRALANVLQLPEPR